MTSRVAIVVLPLLFSLAGCASNWKIHGGPADCIRMCSAWDLEFTAMVGVGSQDRTGDGATACVCQPRREKQSAIMEGAGSTTSSLAAPITAAELAAAQAAYMAQQSGQMHQQSNNEVYQY